MIKKAVGSVVVLAVGYVAASWWTGQVAHRSVDAAVAEAEKMYGGIFKVVDRKSSNGIFRSIEDVTIEISPPLPAAQTAATDDGARFRRVQLNANEALAQDGNDLGDAPAAPPFKVQFTVHNDIRHGPIPGLGFGLARIETSLVFDEFVQRMLKGLLDTDKPFRVLTTLGFTGGGRIQALSPKMNIALPMNAGSVEWRGMDIGVDFTRGMRELTIDGGMPGFSMTTSEGPSFSFEQLTITGKLRKHLENLYLGNEEVRIKSIAYNIPGSDEQMSEPTEGQINDILYGFVIAEQSDKVNVSIKLGASAYRGAPVSLNNIRFNFSLNGLHAETASQLYKQLETFGMQPDDGGETALNALADVSQMFVKLLEHSPELVLDDIGFATDAGELKIVGRAAFAGVDAQDPAGLAGQLAQKLKATIEIDFAQGVLEDMNGSAESVEQMLAQLEQEGYVARKNKHVAITLAYADGAITANDKPLDPSAFGGMFGGQAQQDEMALESEADVR
jgi:uncharacterized protein YdgA (DUF945 family)